MEYLVKEINLLKDTVVIKIYSNDFGMEVFKVHAVAFANNYITIDKKIDKEYLSILLKESKFYEIKDQIIKKLKYKEYSKSEIIKYLNGKLNEDECNKLIADLERNNYINDYNYVKRIFNIAENKLKGKLFIEDSLKDKEIDENLIQSFFSNYNEKYLARKLVKRELNKLKDKYSKSSIINKITYKLNYNGFSDFIINEEILDLEYLKNNDDNELLLKDYQKLLKKYKNKFKNKELDRKVIESLLLKGYNYKSIKNVVEGMNEND